MSGTRSDPSFQKQVVSTVNAGSPGDVTFMVYSVSCGIYHLNNYKEKRKPEMEEEMGRRENGQENKRSQNKVRGTGLSSVGWRGPETPLDASPTLATQCGQVNQASAHSCAE